MFSSSKCTKDTITLVALQYTDSSTTPQLQLQLHYATLHPAVVGEMTDQVTVETIATTPKATPITFQYISGFALPFVILNNQALLEVSSGETSATALYGTTGTY